MLRELFRFTISRFHNWNDWWENQFQYFSRWQPLQIFYYMGARIFEWENILPDRLDTHTNRSMNRSSAISFAVNYSGWIMKCSNCGPIKQWFWLWRRHSEREDDEMKRVKHKRMWTIMQFVSLKLMWRIPRKAFTSHCCRHRWLEHRWMYRYIPTCATAVLRTDRIYNFGVLWMCMFYRRLSGFFFHFSSRSQSVDIYYYWSWIYWVSIQTLAGQTNIFCLRTQPETAFVCVFTFLSWTYVCNWCVASCCILIGTLIPQYLFSIWLFPTTIFRSN